MKIRIEHEHVSNNETVSVSIELEDSRLPEATTVEMAVEAIRDLLQEKKQRELLFVPASSEQQGGLE